MNSREVSEWVFFFHGGTWHEGIETPQAGEERARKAGNSKGNQGLKGARKILKVSRSGEMAQWAKAFAANLMGFPPCGIRVHTHMKQT